MSQYLSAVDKDGVRGFFLATELDQPQVTLLLDKDRRITVPRDLLVARSNGAFYLLQSVSEVERRQQNGTWLGEDEAVVPITTVAAGRERIETGNVRINKVVREEEQIVEASLLKDVVDIRRVPIDRVIDEPVSTRYEGETLVIPVVEEVLIVEKRYLLKEEIHVTRRQVKTQTSQTIPVHHEAVIVKHDDPNDPQTAEED